MGQIDIEEAKNLVLTPRERILSEQVAAVTSALREYGYTVPEPTEDAPDYATRLGRTVRHALKREGDRARR